MKKFNVGSRRFFGDMPGYIWHDNDVLYLLDEEEWPEFVTSHSFVCRKDKCDIFFFKKISLQDYINDVYSAKTYEVSKICTLLVPEIAEYMGLTIQNLPSIEEFVNRLSTTRHAWYIMLYNDYIENGGFFWTEEQKAAAYEVFKEARSQRYVKDIVLEETEEEITEETNEPNTIENNETE